MRNIHMRRPLALGLFVIAFGLLWASNRQGVLLPDAQRHISVPEELTVPLQMRAAYNETMIHFQYRWPAERPHVIHDALRFENGEWVRYGSGEAGPEPYGLHEDRVAMLVDDGSVPEFGRYGGYITVGNRLDGFSDGLTTEEVEAHPYFGKIRGQDAATKYLPATRTDPADWGAVQPEERLAQLRKAGYFLDLWHWRSNRGGPIGVADDQVVAESRDGDEGSSAWSTNWDSDKKQPKFMFDPAKAGYASMRWDDVLTGSFSLDLIHHLHADTMLPFDANHAWQEGDTLPRRVLRDPSGSRGDITATKHWENGYWTVSMSRALDTGNPLDDKAFHEGGSYDIAVAMHRNATGRRWHYVSLPITLGLGREAELQAERISGEVPEWQHAWHEVTLFYPGQVSWPLLISTAHAGAERIAQGIPVKSYHSPDQLAHYGVEVEYAQEILKQWRLTLLVGLLLFFAIGFALLRGTQSNKE
ncbi:MAG TPA: ethylbenzene dehydrogenase-related protein [Thiopseudomonas sp.]|nr:ethylbenzene dehydrogenase-related protein [Thiopseudomonas sp.]